MSSLSNIDIHSKKTLRPCLHCGTSVPVNHSTNSCGCHSIEKGIGYSHSGGSCKKVLIKPSAPALQKLDRQSYERVKQYFYDSWKAESMKPPKIKTIYAVIETDSLGRSYQNYLQAYGNEKHVFHGTVRECTIGSGGNTYLCRKSACALCGILRVSFKLRFSKPTTAFGSGIYTSSASNKAIGYCKYSGAMLVVKVVLGSVWTVAEFEAVKSCPTGYNSVVFDRHEGKRNETVVYEEDAIRPAFLIVF